MLDAIHPPLSSAGGAAFSTSVDRHRPTVRLTADSNGEARRHRIVQHRTTTQNNVAETRSRHPERHLDRGRRAGDNGRSSRSSSSTRTLSAARLPPPTGMSLEALADASVQRHDLPAMGGDQLAQRTDPPRIGVGKVVLLTLAAGSHAARVSPLLCRVSVGLDPSTRRATVRACGGSAPALAARGSPAGQPHASGSRPIRNKSASVASRTSFLTRRFS